MATPVQTFQAALPLELSERLSRLRRRYAAALRLAGQGDYSRAPELRMLAGELGRLLAGEAKKSPEQRGGLNMVELSLAVNRFLPELRGFTQHELSLREQARVRAG